jgi:hypothetical protein
MERTAYPRFRKVLATRDLQTCYTPRPDELGFEMTMNGRLHARQRGHSNLG